MKHLLNYLSEEEKNSIIEQHEGGMRVNPSRFKSLLESKMGNVRPLVEQSVVDDWKSLTTVDGWKTLVDGWKKIIRSTSPLFGVLNSNTGKQVLKTLFDVTPAGVIKNMSIAAANGDANSLSQAFQQAQKRGNTDFSELKNAAFKDMKSFGKLLQQGGIK